MIRSLYSYFGLIFVGAASLLVPADALTNTAPCPPMLFGSGQAGSQCGSIPALPQEGAYFVDPAATGANDGTSPEDAWTHLQSVGTLPTGADLYLKSGAVFEDQRLVVRWSGTDTDPAVIGSYCVRGATFTAEGCLAKAEINGTFEAACRAQKSCIVDQTGAVPSNRWDGLVQVEGNYVVVENLHVADSAAQGVKTGSNKHHITFQHLEVAFPAAAGIRAGRGAHHLMIRHNYVHDADLCHADYAECPDWPATILLAVGGGHSSVAEYNEVHRSYGEGIGIYSVNSATPSQYNIVRRNRISDVRSASIYISGTAYNVVEGNVVWQPPVPTYPESVDWEGIGINAEDDIDSWDAVGNVVRNNVIHNRSSCFRIGIGPKNGAAGIKVGVKAYGNTCIGMQRQGILLSQTVRDHNSLTPESEFRNNIIYAPNLSDKLCNASAGMGNWSSNMWSHGLTHGLETNCVGPGDIISKPDLANDPDSWSFPSPNVGPTMEHFAALSTAPGQVLQKVILDDSEYALWSELLDPPRDIDWERQNVYDISNIARSTDAPTIGAVEAHE